jgi:hypothetical protein
MENNKMAKNNKKERSAVMSQQVELAKQDGGRHRFRAQTLDKNKRQKRKADRSSSKRQLRQMV